MDYMSLEDRYLVSHAAIDEKSYRRHITYAVYAARKLVLFNVDVDKFDACC